jgi:hypothetical protein
MNSGMSYYDMGVGLGCRAFEGSTKRGVTRGKPHNWTVFQQKYHSIHPIVN